MCSREASLWKDRLQWPPEVFCHPANTANRQIYAQALQVHNYLLSYLTSYHTLFYGVLDKLAPGLISKLTPFFFSLYLNSPSYVVPSSLSHGIKLVNPMFRGYAQQVGPQQKHAIIPEMLGFFFLQCWCLCSEGRAWAQGSCLVCVSIEYLGGIQETWVLFRALPLACWYQISAFSCVSFLAEIMMVTSFIKDFEICWYRLYES